MAISRSASLLCAAMLSVGVTAAHAWTATYSGLPVTTYSGTAFADTNPSNYIWFGAGYNTAAYQALYAGYSPAPGGYADSTAPTLSTKTLNYGKITFALKTAGNYSFSIKTPGSGLYDSPTTYDMQSTLYAAVGSTDPFVPANIHTNLVAFNDDTKNTGSANPYPLHYLKQDSTTCVTVTLVYTSWSNNASALAELTVEGPAQIAATCTELTDTTVATPQPVPASQNSTLVLMGMILSAMGAGALYRRRKS